MVEKQKSAVRGLCCALVCAAATAAFAPAPPSASQPQPQPQPQPQRTIAERWHATLHGGIATAANTATTCIRPLRTTAAPCSSVQQGARGRNEDYVMSYADVDDDPNTYNSTRAALRLPQGATVRYARLYWGGNIRAGEVKPVGENRRVLIAENRGSYRWVEADSLRRHRRADGADAYQSSADVTPLVRRNGSGAYTVAQLNVANGSSPAGAWGGWTLVVAYQDERSPRRHISLQDGLAAVEEHPAGLPVPVRTGPFRPGARGSAGVVGYDGDRGAADAPVVAAAGRRAGVALRNAANPLNDVFNSTVTDLGRRTARHPAYANTLGYDSDVLDLGQTLRSGGRGLSFRFAPGDDAYLLGALYTQVEAAGRR